MNGIELIAAERQRQIDVEKWTPEHDDLHKHGQMIGAAHAYVHIAEKQVEMKVRNTNFPMPNAWPWDDEWWKPSPDPVRNLVKAGALIAAEIDRLQRVKEK